MTQKREPDVALLPLLELFSSAALTPLQREIAQLVLENAEELSYSSISEAADLLGVSAGSLSRFAHALSLNGYPALRASIREAVTNKDQGSSARGKLDHWIDRAMMEQIQDLERLRLDLGARETLLKAAAALSLDQPLIVFGVRVSEGFARSVAMPLSKIHPDVRLVTSADSMALEQIHQAHRRGCRQVLAILLPRYPRESIETVRQLIAEGMQVTLITGSPPPPGLDDVEFLLTVPVGTRLLFDLSSAALVTGHLYVQAVAEVNQPLAKNYLQDADRFETRHRIYR
jgi:DNA-binding MurR/RpiR family transcriptional regulator